MDVSNGRLSLKRGAERLADMVKKLYEGLDPDVRYGLDRRAFNAQRAHPHPSTLTAARRRKLRRN